MRFLADENFPGPAIEALRASGYDVAWVRTDAPGSTDDAVLARAVSEQRVLLTFDTDFGYLALKAGLPSSCGIILFRALTSSPQSLAELAVTTLASRDDWSGQFAVVQERRIRMRRLQPR